MGVRVRRSRKVQQAQHERYPLTKQIHNFEINHWGASNTILACVVRPLQPWHKHMSVPERHKEAE